MIDFKGLIDTLRRKARDDVYVGPSVTLMMADMPREEMLIALTEIVKAISAMNRDGKVSLKERFRAMTAFDDRARPIIATLVNVYLGHEKIEGLNPRHVLPSLIASWHELAAGYKVCLKQHAQSPSSRFTQQAELITLRAMGYYAMQAKWSYLRYFEPEARVWRNLNRMYQIADAGNFANKPVARYPDENPSTVAEHYLRAALLKLAEPERRRPEDVWRIDEWLTTRFDLVRIEKVIRPRDQTFGINLEEPKPPMKLRRNMIGEQYRYLATESLARKFAEEAETLKRAATLLSGSGPSDPVSAKLMADLAVVYSHAGQNRARRAERAPIARDVAAAVGFEDAKLTASGNEVELDTWTLVDESANGMGAHYKAHHDDRLQVGELVFLREQDGRTSLNIVRRLTKSREGQVRVGAERIAAQPVTVTLNHAGIDATALFCKETTFGTRALVTDQLDWLHADDITLTAGSKRYGVKLGIPQEQAPGFVLCDFGVRDKR